MITKNECIHVLQLYAETLRERFGVRTLCLFVEELLGCHVDVVRKHRNMNALLRKEIEKDSVYVL